MHGCHGVTPTAPVTPTDESAADNRNLLANQTSQAMTKEQIMEMREQGATGKQIVSTIVDNSAYGRAPLGWCRGVRGVSAGPTALRIRQSGGHWR